MEGQGVAASSASAVGRHGESGPHVVPAAESGPLADNQVTSDIADCGDDQGRNGDDSHVMITSGHPEASAQDVSMPQSPDSSQPPQPPYEAQSSQEHQAELPSQQIETDKADNIGDPDRKNDVVARDENTGHNQAAGGLAPPAVDASAANTPAADDSQAAAPPEGGEPETVQFPAVPSEPAQPEPAQPEPAPPGVASAETGEPLAIFPDGYVQKLRVAGASAIAAPAGSRSVLRMMSAGTRVPPIRGKVL